MSTKKETKQEKQPRTIKVSTLVKIAVALTVMAAMYGLGAWTTNEQNKAHAAEVKQEAASIVQRLKAQD